jgi:mevalonate kinase
VRRSEITGEVHLHSTLPVGAGLGASAALSVAVTRWLQNLKVVANDEEQDFARQLENLFHGESSGVDVAVALSGQPLRYVRGEVPEVFKPNWSPRCYVSYSGKRGVTLECVQKVKSLIAAQPLIGEAIDQDMRRAVHAAEQALRLPGKEGFTALREAFDLGLGCFEKWGLNQGSPDQHLRWLREVGASAVKPTGSGNGGYILSLWEQEPPAEVGKKLIPCF